MVSNPALQYRPAHAPRDFGALIQSSFALWFASLRPTFLHALWFSLLSQLPWLGWWWNTRERFVENPLMAWIEPSLFSPTLAGTVSATLATLASLLFFLAMLRRQGLIARGQEDEETTDLAFATRRFPAALLASLTYTGLTLLALAPVGVAVLVGQGSDDPLVLLQALLVGLLVCAVPLAWVSIAASFIYPPILLDRQTALSAQRLSFQLVRGHWPLAAGLVSLPLLAYLGILGTVGAVPFTITGVLAASMDGASALLRPGWLVFGQLLCAPLMALLLPLATAGYSVCHEELRLRAAAPISA